MAPEDTYLLLLLLLPLVLLLVYFYSIIITVHVDFLSAAECLVSSCVFRSLHYLYYKTHEKT
jgi:hypothetical protein